MTIARALERTLSENNVRFDVVAHRLTGASTDTAEAAHVSGRRLAKGIVLEDEGGYLMAVLPANLHVDLQAVRARLGRDMRITPEAKLADLFADCAPGAVPPVGAAYEMDSVLDERLLEPPDIYFEAGDHESLVHVRTADFLALLGPVERGAFGVLIGGPSGPSAASA